MNVRCGAPFLTSSLLTRFKRQCQSSVSALVWCGVVQAGVGKASLQPTTWAYTVIVSKPNTCTVKAATTVLPPICFSKQ